MKQSMKSSKTISHDANNGTLHGAICVATVSKAFGTAGEIIIKFTSAAPESLYELLEKPAKAKKVPMFIEFDALPVPFFIERFAFKGSSGASVKFTTVNDLKYAEELVGKKILMELEEENAGLEGFTVIDQSGREVGKVSHFLDYPMNPCLEIARTGNGATFVTPVNEELLLDIKPEKRTIVLSIPVGIETLND